MNCFEIRGGRRLYGEITVQGSKNSALPLIAACLLNKGKTVLHNCPDLSDVRAAIDILNCLGCNASFDHGRVVCDARFADRHTIPEILMNKMRSSVIFLGSLLSRFGKAELTYPGGCEIGARPIDIHIEALKKLGVSIKECENSLNCLSKGIIPGRIVLPFPSVGATENIILATVLTKGRTIIKNAAKEPEIVDLQGFLNNMGASVYGAETGTITIDGTENLTSCEYKVIPDRIAAATFMCACLATDGQLTLKNVTNCHLDAITNILRKAGAKIDEDGNSLTIRRGKYFSGVGSIETDVYPAFPTDAQPPLTACMCIADGRTVLREKIFESRFRHIPYLNNMGADITVFGDTAQINGVKTLTGDMLTAHELRGGAALVIAGLCAKGKSIVGNVKYIDRGYEKLEEILKSAGADIQRI